MNTRKRLVLCATLIAALAAAGCGGDDSNDPTYMQPPPPTPVGEGFTSWSKGSVFAQPENTVPIIMDALVFRFDGDDDPNAYSDLLPAG